MRQTLALKLTAISGALAVGLGAFGAHGLQEFLASSGRLDTWHTAGLYHLIHSVVMLVLAAAAQWKPKPWMSFFIGVILFSGSLYLLCLTGIGWLGAVTPVGGVLLVAGWIWLALS